MLVKIITIIFIIVYPVSCKKNTTACYSCHVHANGDDTIICDKSKAQLDAWQNTVLQGGCVKNP